MDCYSFDKIISDYIESNLNLKQRQAADEHIAKCTRCYEKLADMVNLLDTMKSLPRYKTRLDFNDRLMARIDRHNQQKESPFIWVFHEYSRVISVAAAALLLVATSLFIYTSVVAVNNPSSVPSAEIRSIKPGTNIPRTSASTHPEFVNSNGENTTPDTSNIENPGYEHNIMMVNE